jgi:hypothetical protein
MRHAKRPDQYLCDTVEQQFTHLSSLGVKWSQVQILSARPRKELVEGGFRLSRNRPLFTPQCGVYSNGIKSSCPSGMAERANGDGSTYKRMKDGRLLRWEGVITDADTGNVRRVPTFLWRMSVADFPTARSLQAGQACLDCRALGLADGLGEILRYRIEIARRAAEDKHRDGVLDREHQRRHRAFAIR